MNSSKIDVPILMRWKVSKEEIQKQFQLNSYIAKIVYPKEFPDIKYCLSITNEENEIYVSFGFLMREPKIIKANYKISIPTKNYVRNFSEKIFYEDGDSYINFKCSFEEFFDPANGYFIDDYISITMEGIMTFEKEKEICDNFEIKCSTNMDEILYNRDDKDFEIYCKNGNSVKVHKIIISAKSYVFDTMIHSSFKESNESKVLIPDFDLEIIEIAIKFCYGISIANDELNVLNGIKLLQFSDKYDICDLK
uniref:BTB domain-containing protein n=1 Tax=Panagrolaimus davidi TaxID=227884 RepID=A0A914PGA7_9BILA